MDTIVIGAGIAGLTAAYHLKKRGLSFLLLENKPRYGGCLHSVRQNGFLLEKGPSSFLGSHQTLLEHIQQLKLEDQVIKAKESSKNRFILRKGKLVPVPKTPFEFLKTPLLTPVGKLRLLLEPFLSENPSAEEESIAQFVTRRLGPSVLNLVQPVISGIYAGDVTQLSIHAIAPKLISGVKEHGSLFKTLKKSRLLSNGHTLFSFRNGMQTLADALHHKIKDHVFLNSQEIRITKLRDGWRVRWRQEKESREETARSLMLATPAFETAKLIEGASPKLSLLLNAIPYAPVVLIHIAIDRSVLDHPLDGFGFLSDYKENNTLLGSLWSSSIFPGRANTGQSLLTCFAGGSKNPDVIRNSKEEIADKALGEMTRIFGNSFKPSEIFVTKLPKALPQYTLGHLKRYQEIGDALRLISNLHLVGNYFNGISVNDVMRNAYAT